MIDKKKQGKKNKAAGTRFELKVRKDLESKGWIVDKWSNNVELELPRLNKTQKPITKELRKTLEDKKIYRNYGRLIPAKHKFRGIGIPMAIGTGFPDFVAFKFNCKLPKTIYDIIGVEVKSNSYLDKVEKAKCIWLIENKIFSKILIASKDKNKRGGIIYNEYI